MKVWVGGRGEEDRVQINQNWQESEELIQTSQYQGLC